MTNTEAPSSRASSRSSRVIQFAIPTMDALYAAYIPLFPEGGLFIPTTRDYRLGDSVYLMLTLLDDERRYPITGTVAWINPARATGGRKQGIGVRFPNDKRCERLKVEIERVLGPKLDSGQPNNLF